MTTFYKSDCLAQLKKLPSASIDFIYFNPPYGITEQPWDEAMDWSAIFPELFRIVKRPGTVAIHCSVPFNYTLIRAAPKAPNYSWYWDKIDQTTPLLAKKQPLRCMEEVLVWTFSATRPRVAGKAMPPDCGTQSAGTFGTKYNPQRVGDELRLQHADGRTNYVARQRCKPVAPKLVRGKYQTHLIRQKKHVRGFATRPDELIELFIKSYTNPGDVILDPTCYLGLSGVLAKRLERRWIGIDKYFYPSMLLNSR